MKTLLLALGLFFSVNVFSQVEINTSIKFDHLQHDFGKVKQGDSAVHYFTFTNTGKKPLIISEIKTTCSCTASDWPKDPVAPGKEGKIRVSFDTKDKNGFYAKGINMFSNAGESNMIVDIEVVPK